MKTKAVKFSAKKVTPEEKEVKGEKRVWNKNFVPKYADGIARYQDPEDGLWKRLDSWQRHVVKETGENKLNPEFMPQDMKEVLTDKIGRYYVAKNGVRVYFFDKIKNNK